MTKGSSVSEGALRAIITGGASGIGLATANALRSALGAEVGIIDRSDTGPNGFRYARADVTDDARVRAAVSELVDGLGGLDILVNNAGIGAQGTVEDNDDDEWQRVLDVNLVGMARVTRAALPTLRASEHGAIVNTCSAVALMGLPNRVLYSASKGGVLAFTLALAADLLPDGIRVNAVSPGTTDTPWIGRLLDAADDPVQQRSALEARQPHGRLVSADEVAQAIVYLASPSSASTTGTIMRVDGGLTAVLLPR
jgi:NAD(P)-dependent dehydrogenase (short-subunit alcohol dehydrogenase family)